MFPDPIRPHNPANSGAADAEPATSFHLKGVLISQSGRSALVNGELSREGDRVGGAEILAITEGAVRILMGSRELTVHVGSTAVQARSFNPATGGSREPPRLRSVRKQDLPVGSVRLQVPALAGFHAHPVKQGETLSGISQHYLSDGVTRNQMMIALFQTNPQAFSGNINVLHEGAILRIPDGNELLRQAPETATAEVLRQTEAWQIRHQQPTRLAKVLDQGEYGPVSGGETLSGIAERALPDGVTMNQMMIALFQANPQAFSNNINLLHEGAILRIPEAHELRRQEREIATAEVVRQTDAWRTGYWQQARSTAAYAHMTASSLESVNPTTQSFP